ncbi:hypothetical protein AGMMS49940_05840 [Spirochaetia bacterium]|nr:hypothetical protein AGMMS49940_05840 [Spirochaetia bacterium]
MAQFEEQIYELPVGSASELDANAQIAADVGAAHASKKFSWTTILSKIQSGLNLIQYYIKPASGIPASDMAAAVQTAIGKANNAMPKTGGTFTGAIFIPAKTGNPVNNGSAIASEAQLFAVKQTADTVKGVIPSDASATNKLATQDYVNNNRADKLYPSIAGGDFASLNALKAGPWYLVGGAPDTPSKYQWANVSPDAAHDNDRTRYVYSGSGTDWRYDGKDSTNFTPAQQAALDSTITAALVQSAWVDKTDFAEQTQSIVTPVIDETDIEAKTLTMPDMLQYLANHIYTLGRIEIKPFIRFVKFLDGELTIRLNYTRPDLFLIEVNEGEIIRSQNFDIEALMDDIDFTENQYYISPQYTGTFDYDTAIYDVERLSNQFNRVTMDGEQRTLMNGENLLGIGA